MSKRPTSYKDLEKLMSSLPNEMREQFMPDSRTVLCPACGRKTKVKVSKDTALKDFPLWCPWCKREFTVSKDAGSYEIK